MTGLLSLLSPGILHRMGKNHLAKYLAGGIVLFAVLLLALRLTDPREEPPSTGVPEDRTSATNEENAPPDASSREALPPAQDATAELEQRLEAARAGEEENEYPVDLAYLRAKLPDNLYWKLGAPTEDPEILRERAEEEKRWNDLYGKVLSNTATEEEIRRYYEYRRQLSEDYIEVASLMLTEYGDRLPERDQGLLQMSIKMHLTRLEEIPREIDDALARKRAYDQRKEAWLKGE